MVRLEAAKISVAFTPGVYTDISTDLIADAGIYAKRGIIGNGPADRIAGLGKLEFTLDNGRHNSASTIGYYSPNHVSVRSGWTYGLTVKLVVRYAATDYTVWLGKIRSIDPDPGLYNTRRVRVTAYDAVSDLTDAQIREVDIQIDQNEVNLMIALLGAMPTTAVPVFVADPAVDTYPYVFDDLRDGMSALEALSRLVFSARGILFVNSSNQLVYRSRTTLAAESSVLLVAERDVRNDDTPMVIPSALGHVYNRVGVTIHPRRLGTSATTVLFAAESAVSILPKASITVRGTYRDPTNLLQVIGGTDFQAFTLNTDVMANTEANGSADGSGSDVSTQISATGTVAYASYVKFVIQNNSIVTVYLVDTFGNPLLQLRGRPVYEDAPLRVESYFDRDYGERDVELDLPYQDDANVAQDLADYIRNTYSFCGERVDQFELNTRRSTTLMQHAIQREIGDVVTLTESMSGIAAARSMITGITLRISPQRLLSCVWDLTPARFHTLWILDDAVLSVLDDTTVLGYA